jgi:alkanesulfonate monooxygenase SsuD/methylene tetrahydromethanopterin reductase-like flavin-dependent oxidoreductase (luciferase family)
MPLLPNLFKKKKHSPLLSSGRPFDIFFSFSKMNLDGTVPPDVMLYNNLFEQIEAADKLGFKKAWVGEAHFSIRPEQIKPQPLLPHFNGELCINTDILQIAHVAYPRTNHIEIGSAIRNILVNGGPIAHAEAIRNFLTIQHDQLRRSGRKLNIGFGIGRFEYANAVYGVEPRNELERKAWSKVRGLILREACEIFLRLLKGELLGSKDIPVKKLTNAEFDEATWAELCSLADIPSSSDEIIIPPIWVFEPIKLIPEEVALDLLDLTVGSHDPELQVYLNQFHPVKVFNLSVTPNKVIDETHERLSKVFHPSGGTWKRAYMPRTIMIFVNAEKGLSPKQQSEKAALEAKDAMTAYWKAMEGTVDEKKVAEGMENALYGNPEEVLQQLNERFHPEDRLMTWFDFNTNDKNVVIRRMTDFMEFVGKRC